MEDISQDEVVRAASDPSKLAIIAMLSRPGVRRFAMTLEHRYYPPDTPANDDFQLFISKWAGMAFVIMVIPIEHRPRVEEVARESQLRVADGVPTMVETDGLHPFFVNGPNAFSLENMSGSPVYKGGAEEMLKAEDAELDLIPDRERLRRERN